MVHQSQPPEVCLHEILVRSLWKSQLGVYALVLPVVRRQLGTEAAGDPDVCGEGERDVEGIKGGGGGAGFSLRVLPKPTSEANERSGGKKGVIMGARGRRRRGGNDSLKTADL